MISAIVDVAHTLARLLVESGDARDALSVAVMGLGVDACSERLKDDAVAAALAHGDVERHAGSRNGTTPSRRTSTRSSSSVSTALGEAEARAQV